MEKSWQLKTGNVIERSETIFNNQTFTDCEFVVGDSDSCTFKAHKLFLAMSSPVFEAMFYGELAETQPQIPIPDIDPFAFHSMLNYIYTNQLMMKDVDQALSVWRAAEKYQLPDLVYKCVTQILFKVDASNVCKALEHAILYSSDELKEKCEDILAYNQDSPLKYVSEQGISLATLLAILDLELLSISSEFEVFLAVEKWATEECVNQGLKQDADNMRNVSKGALQKIRFLTMSSKEFGKNCCLSLLLTRYEAFSIFVNLQDPEHAGEQLPLPEGFSPSMESRVANATPDSQGLLLHFCDIDFTPVTHTTKKTVNFTRPTKFSLSFSIDCNAKLVSIAVPLNVREPAICVFNSQKKLVTCQTVVDEDEDEDLDPSMINYLIIPQFYMEKNEKYTVRVETTAPGSCTVGVPRGEGGPLRCPIDSEDCNVTLSDYGKQIIITGMSIRTKDEQ